MDTTCVIVQGKIYPEILNELLETYKDIKNKILSTWTTEDKSCIEICKQNGFDIIIQEPPEYCCPTNYQVKSVNLACNYALSKGFTHGFRIRADIKINKLNKLLEILLLTSDKLSFLTMFQNLSLSPEYLTDYLIFGPLPKLERYFSIYQKPDDSRFVELFLMETYFNKNKIVYNDIKDEIYLFQKNCYIENITVEYTKPQYKNQGNLIVRYYNHNCHSISQQDKKDLNII
jgi:hypothetical protein